MMCLDWLADQIQVMHCFRCHGTNKRTLVGLLHPYPMETKERLTDMPHTRLEYAAF